MTAHDENFISTRRIGTVAVSLVCEMSGLSPISLNVPEEVWRKQVPELADADSATLGMAEAIIQTDDAIVVIDPVIEDPGSPLREEVAREFSDGDTSPGLQVALDTLGIDSDDVTHVLITHAHFDHCLGLTVGEDGNYRPRFPNAQHILGRADWRDARERPDSPRPGANVNYFRWSVNEMWPRLDVIHDAGLLELIDGQQNVTPGVTLLPAPGESAGHYVVRVESGDSVFYHFGDLVHFWFECAHPDWMMNGGGGRDLDAMVASRRELLPRAAAEGALVTFSHVEFPGWGRIIPDGDWLRWEPIV